MKPRFWNALILVFGLLAGAAAQAQVNISGALAAGDATLPGPNRLYRDGVASTCGAAKGFPGTTPSVGQRYDEYTVTNTGAAQCVTFTISATTCSAAGAHLTAYSGAFVPGNVATGYLGDSGSTSFASTPRTMSIDMVAGQTIRLVVSNGDRVGDCDYTVTATAAGVVVPGASGGVAAVPTLGEWSLMLLGLLAAGLGVRNVRQRQA